MVVNFVDIIFLVIVVLSGILSFQKGFIQEIMRISSWVGAGTVALYSYDPLLPVVKKYIDMDIGASAITGASSFILSLIIFYIISHFITGIVKFTPIGALNKSLGFVFGLIRGLAICSVLYIAVIYAYGGKKIDEIQNAKSQVVLDGSSKLLIAFLPENFENKINGSVKLLQNNAGKLEKVGEFIEENKDEIGNLIDENIE